MWGLAISAIQEIKNEMGNYAELTVSVLRPSSMGSVWDYKISVSFEG